ncbi:IS66 family insertion sequence element accessory protein TnpB [Paraburkholderia strydomiana]|uniref:IS66 family insertion sequence element accessory protein TnpB n=1 Tax=Paraburkholderia strydomiana TaxID=1245417 RepID=UPI0038BC54DE
MPLQMHNGVAAATHIEIEVRRGATAITVRCPRRATANVAAGMVGLIRIDAIWLATEPVDMRAGADTLLARVVKVFGAARPHHAYLFANPHLTQVKVPVYDGLGIWLAARRLNKGRFVWTNGEQAVSVGLSPEQLQALVMGLPWRTLAPDHAITVLSTPSVPNRYAKLFRKDRR